MFLYIDPLKQGLKQSIRNGCGKSYTKFLYIDPLKQGLKHFFYSIYDKVLNQFLYIDPLKQGLKQYSITGLLLSTMFLYIDPLKQGLKLKKLKLFFIILSVFIHRSIKTRIETRY